MTTIKTRVKKLIKDADKIVGKREKHYIHQSEKWQDSDAGSKYYEKTEALREGADTLRDGLNYFPNL